MKNFGPAHLISIAFSLAMLGVAGALIAVAVTVSIPFRLHLPKKYYFCSPLRAKILKDGKPLSNHQINLEINGAGLGKKGFSTTLISDEKGEIFFEGLVRRRILKPMIQDMRGVRDVYISAETSLEIVENGISLKKDQHLFFFKRINNYLLGGEGFGDTINIECILTSKEQNHGEDSSNPLVHKEAFELNVNHL